MNSNRKALLVGVGLAFLLSACGGAQIKVNPNVKLPLPVTAEAPAFLFPVNLTHLGSKGDATAMGITVTAGIIAKYGKKVVSGQQLFDLVGNLSWELAETIEAQVRNGSFQMTGSAERIASALSALMEKIIQKLVELKVLDKPLKFKYIIALHSHGTSKLGGKMLGVNSWGGIYDVDTKEILTYINSEDTMANDDKALLGQVPNVYNNIIEKLLTGAK
jgi:hypothetical protein